MITLNQNEMAVFRSLRSDRSRWEKSDRELSILAKALVHISKEAILTGDLSDPDLTKYGEACVPRWHTFTPEQKRGYYREMSDEQRGQFFTWSRMNGIDGSVPDIAYGGSDMAAILGISPWVSQAQLYREKTNRKSAPVAPGTQAAYDRGHRAEPVIREMFGKAKEIEVYDFPFQFRSRRW
jgi:hypothetical protein